MILYFEREQHYMRFVLACIAGTMMNNSHSASKADSSVIDKQFPIIIVTPFNNTIIVGNLLMIDVEFYQ
jgi:hypothetical protein